MLALDGALSDTNISTSWLIFCLFAFADVQNLCPHLNCLLRFPLYPCVQVTFLVRITKCLMKQLESRKDLF